MIKESKLYNSLNSTRAERDRERERERDRETETNRQTEIDRDSQKTDVFTQ